MTDAPRARRLLPAIAVGLLTLLPSLAVGADRPNFVIVFADDLGWADLGCYGNTFHETPAIDRLAREGLRFTQFYSGPVCSPTRANLQSGRDQARFGITQHIPGHRRPYARLIDPVVPTELPLEVETFAERLRAAGYATGYFGKWHLGGAGHGPQEQGWETVIEMTGHSVPARVSATAAGRRTAEFLTDEAIRFIDSHRDRPFVVQVSHYAVHLPLSTTPELVAKYQARPPMPGYPSRPEYAGLVEELDHSVGRIADAIDRAGLAESTLILFLSDNGGLEHEQSGRIVTSNRPLRGEKGTLYEGGVRTPAIARWTGRIAAGGLCTTPATTHDVHPTLLELAEVTTDVQPPLDGVSLARLLVNPQAPPPRESLYWHLPHYHHSTPASALRRGDWKLLEFFEDSRVELYNLQVDLGESRNVAAEHPDLVGSLRAELAAWRGRVGARMPTPNPEYDPARADELARRQGRREVD